MRYLTHPHRILLSIAILLGLPNTVYAQINELDLRKVAINLDDFGYFLEKTNWTIKYPSPLVLDVCWENPTNNFLQQMHLVQDAVAQSWQTSAAITFRGWENSCQGRVANIHIQILDVGPHTKGLGLQIDHSTNGMVLNFVFDQWSPACKEKAMYEKCVTSIAVHEFGHALGFAHEQNRPDTPGECLQPAQGGNGNMLLTPWDKDSVMNYCNATYNNNGVLSKFDIDSIQKTYGSR